MNKRIEKMANIWANRMAVDETNGATYTFSAEALEVFTKEVISCCIDCATLVAVQSTKMANSDYVTPYGRALYEGMYGGAMNVAAGIREHFDLGDVQ